MRSLLPSADLFRRWRLSFATKKLCPVLNYVISRPWSRARQLPRPRPKKKKTGKKLKHVSLCTQHHNLTRKTWQNLFMNEWSNLCEQYLKTDFWPVCYRLKLALASKTIYLTQEWSRLFFVARGHNIALSVKIYSIYNIQFRLHSILNISWYHVTESALPSEFFPVSLSLKYLVTLVNFGHLRFIAYCINCFFVFQLSVANSSKFLVKLDYTTQDCFYCFHFKLLEKMTTEKRLTLVTLSCCLDPEKL